ncbi:MAG: pyruvate kinase [Bacilli bacterium]
MNKTKTIATIGPASQDIVILKALIENGVDLIRFNMNYADHNFCQEIIKKIRKIDKDLEKNTGIIIDLGGPSIRIGKLLSNQAFLIKGTKIRIYTEEMLGDSTKFSINYPDLIKQIKINNIIKMSDGNIELVVVDKQYNYLLCEVIKEGIIYDNQKLNIPEIKVNLPFLNKKDQADIIFANLVNADYLALSFVATAEDVLEINDKLIELGNNHLNILAKVENESAINEIDDIIRVSEGIIIARGDLGISLPMERVPGIQKSIISKCHRSGKISVVATELLSSMEQKSRPTRAEVSDVANAVLDGADAVMLCGETTIGKHPVETLSIMEKIMRTAELDINYYDLSDKACRSEKQDITGVLSHSIVQCANMLNCKAIIVPTMSGYTAKKLSRFRPNCPIIALTPKIETIKNLSLYFGIAAIKIEDLNTIDKIIVCAKHIAINNLSLTKGDKIIITGGYPFKKVKHTNFIEIEEL